MWCKARRPDSCLLNVTWRVKQSSSKTFITLLLFLVFLTCMHSTVVWHVRVTVWQKIWITVLVIVVPSHHKAVICKFMFLFEYKTGHDVHGEHIDGGGKVYALSWWCWWYSPSLTFCLPQVSHWLTDEPNHDLTLTWDESDDYTVKTLLNAFIDTWV